MVCGSWTRSASIRPVHQVAGPTYAGPATSYRPANCGVANGGDPAVRRVPRHRLWSGQRFNQRVNLRPNHFHLREWTKHPDVGKSAASKAVDNLTKRCLDELEQGSDQGRPCRPPRSILPKIARSLSCSCALPASSPQWLSSADGCALWQGYCLSVASVLHSSARFGALPLTRPRVQLTTPYEQTTRKPPRRTIRYVQHPDEGRAFYVQADLGSGLPSSSGRRTPAPPCGSSRPRRGAPR